MITEDSLIQRSKEMLLSKIDHEAVILGISSGTYIGLNNMGTKIINRITDPILVKDLISEFVNLYDEDEEIIRDQILEFLSSLHERSLLKCLDETEL